MQLSSTASNINAASVVQAILPSADPNILSFISPINFPSFSLTIVNGNLSFVAIPSLQGSALLSKFSDFANLATGDIQLAYSKVQGLSFGVQHAVQITMPSCFTGPASIQFAFSAGGGAGVSFAGSFTGTQTCFHPLGLLYV